MSDVISILEKEEKFIPYAYRDHLGFWTIGHGILIDRDKGGGITEEESRYLMGNRVDKARAELDRKLPWLKFQAPEVRDAMVLMAYQMGIGGLLDFTNMLAHLQSGYRGQAAVEALHSLWARQTPARAKRVAKMIRGSEKPVPS